MSGKLFIVMSVVLLSHVAQAGSLTIYAIPSPRGLEWSTPKALAWSTYQNQNSAQTHTIGHANIHLRCDIAAGDEENFEIATGMTSTEDDPTRALLQDEGYGLGILFVTIPGRLEPAQEIAADLESRRKSGLINFMQFKISAKTCSRLAKYVREYKDRGYDQAYGLPNRPRYGEGSGCSAFVASFLDLAGLHTPTLRSKWYRELRVPKHLVGGPLTGNFVRVMDLIRPLRPSRWAKPEEPHFLIQFYDPEALFLNLREDYQAKSHPLGDDVSGAMPVRFVSDQKVAGFELDANNIPTPDENIWLHD